MGIFLCRWVFLSHLSYAVFSSTIVYKSSRCQRSSVVLESSYTTSDRKTMGAIGLTETFALVVIDNGTVRYPYVWLPVKDAVVEVNFTRHQDVVLRDLRAHFPNALTVSVSYFCSVERNLSCDVICRFDDDFIVVSEGEITQRTIQDQKADRICKMEYGLALLEDSWGRIFTRWSALCSYFEKGETIQVNISFTYDTETNTSWCNASVSEPVHCKLTVYYKEKVVGSEPCVRDGLTVGAALLYDPKKEQDLRNLTCSVSGPFVKEVFVDLKVSKQNEEDSDAASREYADGAGATGTGLGIGVVFVLLLAMAVFVLAFRRRLGLRSLDRVVDRVSARFAYLRAETG